MQSSKSLINKQFDLCLKELSMQKKSMLDQISKWREDRIREIQSHVDQQKLAVDQTLNTWKRELEQERQTFLRQFNGMKLQNDSLETQLILEQWNTLKLRLVKIAEAAASVPEIHAINEPSASHRQQDQGNIRELNGGPSQASSRGNPARDTANNAADRNTVAADSASALAPAGRNGNERSQATAIGGADDIISRCPACMMIFPPHMNGTDRNQHVNEHYTIDGDYS